MENVPTGTGWTGALAGKTIQQAVFAGLIDPGNIVAVRELLKPANGTAVDVALFGGNLEEYTVTDNLDGSWTVAHTAPVPVAVAWPSTTARTPSGTWRRPGSPIRTST